MTTVIIGPLTKFYLNKINSVHVKDTVNKRGAGRRHYYGAYSVISFWRDVINFVVLGHIKRIKVIHRELRGTILHIVLMFQLDRDSREEKRAQTSVSNADTRNSELRVTLRYMQLWNMSDTPQNE